MSSLKRRPWRPFLVAVAIQATIGGGIAAGQTVIVTKAPSQGAVEFVLNTTTVGSTTASPEGTATLSAPRTASGAAEMAAHLYVDTCDTLRRVIVIDQGLLLPDPAEGCSRAQIAGLFSVRPVSTLVFDLSGTNPTVLLRQGAFTPRDPDAPSRWGAGETGLVLSAGGGFGGLGSAVDRACGDATTCDGNNAGPTFSGGVAYWLTRYLAAEATYFKAAKSETSGSGTNFRFDSVLDAHVLNIGGKVGVPVGPVRLYGQGGATWHRALWSTSQTIDQVTRTNADGTTTIIPGGSQIYSIETAGWGWSFGGGLEVWVSRPFALYAEAGRFALKGRARDDADGELDDRLLAVVIGARLRIGR